MITFQKLTAISSGIVLVIAWCCPAIVAQQLPSNDYFSQLDPSADETAKTEAPASYFPESKLLATPAESYGWQLMPAGLMYHSYLAGPKEPRINALWMKDQNGKLNWETQLGGRVGLIRYGDFHAVNPNGWQVDVEGGAQTRVLTDDNSDLEAVDFRVGFLLTRRQGLWSAKTGYYHLSAHLGDEFMINNPGFVRLNYVRDAWVFGASRDITIAGRPDARVYGEYAYAFNHEFGAPSEFQIGTEYSPLVFNGWRGSPFFGVNGHFRQDRDWDAKNLSVAGGWQWRSEATNQRFRLGAQYVDGDSVQWSFPGKKESMLGWGLWLDY
jgi:Protein of unknown function (DUF1207)